jgi:hypothetical protein
MIQIGLLAALSRVEASQLVQRSSALVERACTIPQLYAADYDVASQVPIVNDVEASDDTSKVNICLLLGKLLNASDASLVTIDKEFDVLVVVDQCLHQVLVVFIYATSQIDFIWVPPLLTCCVFVLFRFHIGLGGGIEED